MFSSTLLNIFTLGLGLALYGALIVRSRQERRTTRRAQAPRRPRVVDGSAAQQPLRPPAQPSALPLTPPLFSANPLRADWLQAVTGLPDHADVHADVLVATVAKVVAHDAESERWLALIRNTAIMLYADIHRYELFSGN
ncbi:MAG TPA: hypothetical protein VJG32_12385 [Anaerolineae bacterium]|nr:hypothetical protein [Anaerolineae bacterium]